MPHRLIVAGETQQTSSTSRKNVILEDKGIISPFARHNFLLSSNSVFNASTQMASIGPSQTIQCLSSS